MKRFIALALAIGVAVPLAAQASKSDVSYAIGMLLGENAKGTNIDLDMNSLVAGLKDSVAGAKTKFTEAQASQMVQAAAMAARDKAGAANLAAGKAFLEGNKAKAGVKTTASGLQYEILKQGSGPKPKATDTVTVNYEGKLLSGKVFDSSYARNQSVSFPLNGVIKGWTEGLQLMSVGSKYRLYIPSDLAYGPNGAGGAIGPNETLIFEVELLSIGKN